MTKIFDILVLSHPTPYLLTQQSEIDDEAETAAQLSATNETRN